MPSATVHGFDDVWTSEDPTRLAATVSPFRVQGAGSLQLALRSGATGVRALYTPPGPLDLRPYKELRLWTWATRGGDGTANRPFALELGYTDAGDLPGEEHRWYIPVNRARVWEQHAFGIAADRRAQVTGMWLRALTDTPVTVRLDELLAVDEHPLTDLEHGLTALLGGLPLPGVTALAVQPAAFAATTLVTAHNTLLRAGNELALSDRAARHRVTSAVHDQPAGTTTLTIAPGLAQAAASGVTISVVAPVVAEEEPLRPPGATPDPAILLTLTDQREEPERGWNVAQRDSFRPRGPMTVCSVRPPARPVLAEYQILPASGDRDQSLALREAILARVGIDTGLRVNGTVLPVRTLLPPPLDQRVRGFPAPVYLHVGTRVETGERAEYPWVRSGSVLSGPLLGPFPPGSDEPPPPPAPEDQEGIVLRL
ncbi:hypothetical protein Afil01_34100 [Actinorhabdospora filicis]|uniref:Uncharacterized protein n=1 Tax=Actinorhabdospora filicis TaxID=1785913 RepID=A0A9W6SLT6_9ACTN|nr:hypothetical protein [Actinorhabdospora filicis]GLZ78603.1 hypothetical protein Afil01_34100 [Actinorhabdospora filicis]